MTKRLVKLPPGLGGATVEVVTGAPTPLYVYGEPVEVVIVPDVGPIAVPKAKLEDAPPEEPPPGLWALRREDGFESARVTALAASTAAGRPARAAAPTNDWPYTYPGDDHA